MFVNKLLLEKLSIVTEEEQHILENNSAIDPNIYMENAGNVINSKKLLGQGKLITIRPHTRFVHFPPHRHDYVELIYMCNGSTTHIINGNRVNLQKGELLFLSTEAVQEIERAEKDDIAVNFIILPQFFDKVLTMLGEEETPLKSFIIDFISKKTDNEAYLHFKVGDILPIQNLVENLIYTLVYDTQNKRSVNQITMGLLFLQLLNYTDRLSLKQQENSLIMNVLKYIEENYQKGSLSQLAKTLHYDMHWLSREIKNISGKTYTEILQEKRLSQAMFLLKSTNMRIEEISAAVGYDNKSYFHRVFYSKTGLTPRNYRLCK